MDDQTRRRPGPRADPATASTKATRAFEGALLARNPDAWIVTDAAGRIAHWSEGAAAVFGHACDSTLDLALVELLMPGDRGAACQSAVATALADGDARFETLALHRDGSLLYIDFVLRPLQDFADGHVLWSGRDVTQPRLRRAASHLAARYGELLESTPDGMLLVGETGHVLVANSNAQRMFDYEPGELFGRLVDELIPQSLRARHVSHRAGYFLHPRVRSMAAGADLRARRRSGEEFPVEVSLSPLQTEQGLVVISAVRDVTDRVAAARRFRALLEAAPEAIVIADGSGRIVLANSQTDALFGYAREELVGQPVEILLPERFRPAHAGHREAYALQPRVRAMGAGLELFARRKDGSEIPVEISLSPISTEEGMLVSAAIRDITERKAVERRLQEQNVELARASAAKTNFLAGMSHELRTPLNAILGFTGTLLMKLPGPLNVEQERQLRTVQGAGQHLLALINDLLDLTRIESGETHVERAPVDCVEVAREAATQVRPLAEAKGLAFESTLPDGEVTISTDRRALRQILINLLGNAVKYTQQGQVRLRVERHRDGGIRCEVSDTGIGIRAEDRERLFRAFSRLERGNESRQSTGLGLYLSARLAQLLDGTIDFDSAVGRGSTFILYLPER